MKNKLKKLVNILLLVIITFLVLYFSLKDDFNNIVKEILNLNIIYLIIAILLVFISYLFKSLSLQKAIIKFNKDYSLKKSFRLVLITNFFNAVTPFATGGQPFQVYTLKKDGVSITNGTNIIIQNFIVYQIALVLLGIVAVTYNYIFNIFKEATILKELVTIGFIINTLVALFLLLIAFAKKFSKFIVKYGIIILAKIKIVKNKEEIVKKWNNHINNFHSGAKILLSDKKTFIETIIYNFLSLICLYLVPAIILYGMNNYNITTLESIVSSAYTMIMGAFVPIPGGTGGLEYGYTRFFGNFIKGPALNASMLIWRFITYYLGLIIGAIALNIKRK